MSGSPEALDAHPAVEVAMNRSIPILLWASAMCFLAPYEAEARVLQNSKADYCIGVDHASTRDGADVKVFRCDNNPNQQWVRDEVAPGVFNFVNKKSKKCMGVNHASTKIGADIKQFECDGSENQKWTFESCADGTCTVNKKSGHCLSAKRLGHDVQMEQLKCEGGTTQAWSRD